MKKRNSKRKRSKRLGGGDPQPTDKAVSSETESRAAVPKPAAPPVSTDATAAQHKFHIQETLGRFAKLL